MNVGGTLAGIRVVEFGGLGPGPYCGQLFADMGADVLLIDREHGNGWPNPVMDRGKARLVLDIRSEAGRQQALLALEKADILIEGFRPGVMERLGLGPDAVHALNPRLIYGRMTGWGQYGPLATSAGHDINYIALTGALAAIGPVDGNSTPPLNLVGDFGGGSLFLAMGILAALQERTRSGLGQTVDAAIVDGTASMMGFFTGMLQEERISMDKRRNLLAGAAPFYRCYRCQDGGQIAIGSLEPHFYRELIERIGGPSDALDAQMDVESWEEQAEVLAELFVSKSRSEWCEILEGTDACFAPVLELHEAPTHPHIAARGIYGDLDGIVHPAPAPRFSRTPSAIRTGRLGEDMLSTWLEEPIDV